MPCLWKPEAFPPGKVWRGKKPHSYSCVFRDFGHPSSLCVLEDTYTARKKALRAGQVMKLRGSRPIRLGQLPRNIARKSTRGDQGPFCPRMDVGWLRSMLGEDRNRTFIRGFSQISAPHAAVSMEDPMHFIGAPKWELETARGKPSKAGLALELRGKQAIFPRIWNRRPSLSLCVVETFERNSAGGQICADPGKRETPRV